MTAADIIDTLQRLESEERFHRVWMDKSVRDFLVSALRWK
jgi:hypothetical protein